MQDSQIIELYFARSEEALRATDAAYGRRLQALADRVLRCPEDAQECVSDTYLKAWQVIPPQRPVHFFAFLAQICRRLAFGRLDRREAQMRNAPMLSLTEELARCIPDRQQEAAADSRELGRVLSIFLRELSRENRLVFLRRYWYGDSVREIAVRCGLSEGAVMTRLSRTREKLRKFLEQEGIQV